MIIGYSCKDDPNCIRCFESGCSDCAGNYFLNSSKQCEKCYDPNCVTCYGKRQRDCWICGYEKRYLLLDDYSCTDCNLDGYYKTVQACKKCLPQCKNCEINNYLCTSCESGYFFQGYTCFKCIPNCQNCNNAITCQLCQSGYFLKGYSCIECIPNCQNCNNETTCELCQSGYHIHEQTNQCVICSQQSGYYISGKYCKQCNVACKECSGPTDLDCTICNQFYFQIDKTTKRCQICPNNAYLSSSNQDSNQNYCLVCSCQQCESGHILFNLKQCTQSCESVGSNYIYDSLTNTCTCQQGYNYLVRNPYKNNFDCSNGKGYGYFCDSHNICFQCSQNCSSCTDIQTCIKCNEGSYLWQNACSQNCFPDLNIFPNTQKGICECPEGYNLEYLKSPVQGQMLQEIMVSVLFIFIGITIKEMQNTANEDKRKVIEESRTRNFSSSSIYQKKRLFKNNI
ncbi:variant specific surface protein S2, putative (macronuclear) [Tetrahymena thermophila SB210]|uniref:Variant specific surface protein S2, putative n=1 Tax=Tetrahymena thermophila (strain SB210) TaxID=312017 RepID=Q22TC9_TETTS|nr:variant specific surface protein S2, putative [Tetrahymena thermophila SB210]EAR88509.3 variant specific surface protein S2, putative [Tetrahymena thermophila SB210]|eukprot:XP_001008754.3 variant specific surface protein S2, putative [Tetrahymena thermophila SB210]